MQITIAKTLCATSCSLLNMTVSGFFFSWQPEKHVPLAAVRLPPKESTAKPDYRENEKVEVGNHSILCLCV